MRLESEGIAAFVQNENIVQVDWLMSNLVGGVQVQIAEEDLQAAKDYLARSEREAGQPLDPEI